jgi:hypothetical protein
MADDISKINDEINKLRKELKQKPLKPFNEKDLETAKALLSGLRAEVRELSSDLDFVAKSFKDSVNELSKQNIYLASAKKSLSGISDISRKVLEYRKGDTSLSEKQLKNLQQQAKSKFETLRNDLKSGQLSKENAEEIRNALEYENEFNEALEKTIKYQKEVNQEIGLLGTGLKGIGSLLSKAGFGDLSKPLDDAIEKTKNARLQIKLNEDAIKDLEKEYKNLSPADVEKKKELRDQLVSLKAQNRELSDQSNKYKNIGNSVKDLLTTTNIIDFLIKEMTAALIKSDNAAGELAKSFGISYNQAIDLRSELSEIANLSLDVNVTTAGLQESLIALNKEFGTATMFSGEFLTDFTKLTKQAGYSTEAATGLSRITAATGTDLSDNTSKILGQAKAFNATNKLALNEKTIVEGVARASAATTISLGMNVDRISKAVLQAKAFGATLEQIERSSQALLNFESSISAELEAELLTGKNINLERARMYAINNDIEGVAREISREVGSAAEFGKMNVIQQEALAKSVGMEREELSKALIEREAITKLSGVEGANAKEKFDNLVKQVGMEEAKKRLGDEQLANQMASQSIQDRFNATIEKLRDIFITLAEPLLTMLDPIMDVLNSIKPLLNLIIVPLAEQLKAIGKIISTSIREPLEAVKNIFSGIIDIFKGDFEQGFKKIGNGIIRALVSPVTAIISGFDSLINSSLKLINKIPGIEIKPVNFAEGWKKMVTIEDGEISSNGGLMVSGRKGSFRLNPKDTAVFNNGTLKAGTNLLGNNSTNQNNNGVTAGMMAAFEKYSNRPVVVQIDGKNVATAVGNHSQHFYNSAKTQDYVVA